LKNFSIAFLLVFLVVSQASALSVCRSNVPAPKFGQDYCGSASATISHSALGSYTLDTSYTPPQITQSCSSSGSYIPTWSGNFRICGDNGQKRDVSGITFLSYADNFPVCANDSSCTPTCPKKPEFALKLRNAGLYALAL